MKTSGWKTIGAGAVLPDECGLRQIFLRPDHPADTKLCACLGRDTFATNGAGMNAKGKGLAGGVDTGSANVPGIAGNKSEPKK